MSRILLTFNTPADTKPDTSDGNIKFAAKNNTQGLSMKLLKTLLSEYSKRHPQLNTEDLVNFITNSLEKKTKMYIKRNIDNT